LREVLVALLRLALAEPGDRLVLRDVLGARHLGHRRDLRTQVLHRDGIDAVLELGDHLDLLLDELEPGGETGLDDPESREEQEHEDHRRGRREAHDAVTPETLQGAPEADEDEADHAGLPPPPRRASTGQADTLTSVLAAVRAAH